MTIRLGELVNSGLTAPTRTTISQNARKASIDRLPSIQFSLRRQYERRDGRRAMGFS